MPENIPFVYLNTAAAGLISPNILQTGTDLYKQFETNASAASEHWRDFAQWKHSHQYSFL